MKKIATIFMFSLFLIPSRPVRGDLFGGDVAVLSQILVQAILQLAKLRELLGTASNQLNLLKEVNRGINDSLNLLKTIDPTIEPGIYRDWDTVQSALGKLEGIYGRPSDSPQAQVQRDADQGIAEAVAFNNNYFKWTGQLDEIGELIKNQSHVVSPGGAQKLTAQALGLLIQVMNQNVRAQATSLKLQAQELAIQNGKDKAETKNILDSGSALKTAMQNETILFEVPRF